MEIEKSLNDRIQAAYEQSFDLLYDQNACVKKNTGLDSKTEDALWNFNEGIGEYVNKVLSGRMSIKEMLKDHISIIDVWVEQVEEILLNIKQGELKNVSIT